MLFDLLGMGAWRINGVRGGGRCLAVAADAIQGSGRFRVSLNLTTWLLTRTRLPVCVVAGMVDEVFSFMTGRIEHSFRELLDTGGVQCWVAQRWHC